MPPEVAAKPRGIDKLREGPCADLFALLERCRQTKGAWRNDVALSVCVSETDLLISCVRKNPAHFHDSEE